MVRYSLDGMERGTEARMEGKRCKLLVQSRLWVLLDSFFFSSSDVVARKDHGTTA